MKSISSIFFILCFSLPVFCFSQMSGFNAIKKFSEALGSDSKSQQDTTKTKTGTQSNLAVTDEGSPGDKSNTKSNKIIENPLDKVKKNLAESSGQNGTTGGTPSNLAVTDEGDRGDKTKGKTARKAKSSDTSQETKNGTTTTPDPK